jgi:hypothetical protein
VGPKAPSRSLMGLPLNRVIVTIFLGRLGRGTGSRIVGRHMEKKIWYKGGIPLWDVNREFGV